MGGQKRIVFICGRCPIVLVDQEPLRGADVAWLLLDLAISGLGLLD